LKSSAATLLVGKYVKNWEYNKAERCRLVNITKLNPFTAVMSLENGH